MLRQEYSEDSASEPDVDLENQYYNSKALKEDDPRGALASFEKVTPVLARIRPFPCFDPPLPSPSFPVLPYRSSDVQKRIPVRVNVMERGMGTAI